MKSYITERSAKSMAVPISLGVLSRCLLIPEGGIFYEKHNNRHWYNPYRGNNVEIHEGTYNFNRDIVLIYNLDDKVYIAKGEWIEKILTTCGFRQDESILVPFDSKSVFLDTEFQERFTRLPKS